MRTQLKAKGFTVIEIVIATALLAISLATYLGVQSAVVGTVLRSRNEFTASLIARTILSGIEMRGAAADLKSGDYTIEQAYELFKIPYPDSEVERANLLRFRVNLQSEPWKLTGDVEGLNQITLDILLGDEDRDIIKYTYFVPATNEASNE